jgi:hypothetical protein
LYEKHYKTEEKDIKKEEWICIAYRHKETSDSVHMYLSRFVDIVKKAPEKVLLDIDKKLEKKDKPAKEANTAFTNNLK